ncbi:MAG: hypothetical protein ABR567_00660 [Myxococcales bacterium]|nr:hypothetical protein [Myxococcales bacterium]
MRKTTFAPGVVYRIERRNNRRLYGFVVGAGEWVLLNLLDSAMWVTNGYVAVRLRDVDTAEESVRGSFSADVVRLKRLRPKRPRVSVKNTEDLLRSAAVAAPLLSIEREHDDRGVAWIGRPVVLGPREAVFKLIDTNGKWMAGTMTIKLGSITRVDFGGEYESLLHQLNERRAL